MAKTKSRIQPFLEAVRNARQLIFTVIVIAIFAIAWLVQGGTIDMPEWTKDMRHLDGDDWTKYADVTDADTDKQLSTFEYKSGPYIHGYGTDTECNNNCSPTVTEQRYISTEITLAGADTSFGKTIATTEGATYSGLTSTNGGKVRKISEIWVPKMV
ncbi:hypothetical protein FANTH_1203 [Fusarium anthophilum]|uniref:Uncharacterized protein n=1 Tax=Fusarium anthophilum TaxID=48485 RepID=A0A8H4ZWI0_9HYPO|nr:hypothetical protein FANTH_1203 [Fusarium anthophilum]